MTFVAGSLSGTPVRRVEDDHLLTGRGTYVGNLRLDGMLAVSFVRSPYAHARIVSFDAGRAREMPGVVAVYSASDLDVPPFPGWVKLNENVTRPSLAAETVHFVGDVVAIVVAESEGEAVDAAEAVEVEYEPLPAVADLEAALEPGAPQSHEGVDGNLLQGLRDEDAASVLEDAEVVVRARFVNQRVAVSPMEGSAVVISPGAEDSDYTVTAYVACQMPHGTRDDIATAFDLPPERVRVIAPDVGGAFGAKHLAPETLVAIKVALEHHRPVRWVESRSENLVSMPHGRSQMQYAELGLKRDGTITGLRCRVAADAGAYAGFGGALAEMCTKPMLSGCYRGPRIAFDVAVTATNTTPMGAYRGAGRPEAAALVERIMDMAAAELGMDPAELRKHNFLKPSDFPYTTPTGATYDSGDYETTLDEALRLADYEGLRKEQAERRRRGDRLLLGIGISSYVEVTGEAGGEFASVEVHDDGTATVKAGTSAHGQGHATAFSTIVADRLRITMDRIRFVQSDTAVVPRGGGTGGSRSLQLAGSAVFESAGLLLDRARQAVADKFEAAVEDIVFTPEGRFMVAGVPTTTLDWSDIAGEAADKGEPLVVEHDSQQAASTFPFGAHVSVVEVDMDTGRVTPIRHIAVDDCGRILNPLLVDGQVHGGLASGIAQALWEEYVYDADGIPLTTTLADYAMPSAAELPSFELAHTETPSPLNPLGAKGIGESATVGSTPAVQNAVVDALSYLGIRHIDMPLTAERVWTAIRDAQAGRMRPTWREPAPVFESLPIRSSGDEGPEQVQLNI